MKCDMKKKISFEKMVKKSDFKKLMKKNKLIRVMKGMIYFFLKRKTMMKEVMMVLLVCLDSLLL